MVLSMHTNLAALRFCIARISRMEAVIAGSLGRWPAGPWEHEAAEFELYERAGQTAMEATRVPINASPAILSVLSYASCNAPPDNWALSSLNCSSTAITTSPPESHAGDARRVSDATRFIISYSLPCSIHNVPMQLGRGLKPTLNFQC